MRKKTSRFHSLSDVELVDLLHTAGDELPRQAVNELLRRGPRILPLLQAVINDKTAWTRPLPEWWASVHAVYILGAMESHATLQALLTALRWSDAFDCDWVTEDLPSMFGRLGSVAYEPLQTVLQDATAGWGARSIALSSLAAVALTTPYLQERLLQDAASILADTGEEFYLRQTAANVLLDFGAATHRDLLFAFGKEEAARKQEDPEYQGAFYDWEVDEILEGEGKTGENLEYYRRDWLSFYDPEETQRRQERWAREQDEAAQEIPEEPPLSRRDIRDPCPCGSGRSFESCCYLKVH